MFMKLRIWSVFLLMAIFTQTGAARENGAAENYAVFTHDGEPASIEKIIEALENTDVVFLGESHDDRVAHRLQFEIFKKAFERFGEKSAVKLSLEMFEKDVQIVLDEYLRGLISEKHFLAASRPWNNYEEDYRPLVEFAKEKNLPVIAANAPRRYVNMVSRGGRDALKNLSAEAKNWLAPLPYSQPSAAYAAKFNQLMGNHSTESQPPSGSKILDAQALWDATMAHAISEALRKREGSLVVHLNGSFHTEKRLGTPEHLLKYSPDAKFLVVTMRYEKDFKNFNPAEHRELGDFVVLTDAAQPRSKK